jgi:hypothetical protein
MNRTDIHLLDLPVEILLRILKRLNNMDVLYSLIGVEGLDLLAQPRSKKQTSDLIRSDKILHIQDISYDRVTRSDNIVSVQFFEDFPRF